MTRNIGLTWVLMVGSLPLVACGPSSTSRDDDDNGNPGADLAKIAIDNTEKALIGAHGAGSFIADSSTFAESLTSLGGNEVCVTDCTTDPACPTVCTTETVTLADMQESREAIRTGIDELITQLRDDIFTAQTLEGKDASSATYLFGVEELCGEVAPAEPVPAPTPTPMYDPDCVDYANRLSPRVRFTSASTGNVNAQVLLTPSRRAVASMEFHQDHVSVSADLGEIKATLESIGEDLGTLANLDGTIAFELRQNGNLDYSALMSVVQDLVVAVADETTGDEMQISLGRSEPMMEVRLNGNARTITGATNYGALTVAGPLNAFRDSFTDVEYDPLTGEEIPGTPYTGDIELFVAGVESSITFDGSTDHLLVSGIGLGDAASTLKFDGQVISQLDLNPQNGRHFDLDYDAVPNGALFTFSPTLDVNLLLNFTPLLPQIPEISPSLLNEQIRIWFDGANPSIETSDDQIKIVSGTLNITSASTPEANISVPAGMCLVDSGAVEPTNEAIGTLASGACL